MSRGKVAPLALAAILGAHGCSAEGPGTPLGPDADRAGEELWRTADPEVGRRLFSSSGYLCFTCHGAEGQGIAGPNLTDDRWLHGCTPREVVESVRHGYPEKGMLPRGSGRPMSEAEIFHLARYITSLRGSEPAHAKPPDAARDRGCSVGDLRSWH